ncbi:MAG: JAB domain-containing protein [Planctomycetes bacterium]|nr:JAB domain-containing protein [Planctomycetota bacterium]
MIKTKNVYRLEVVRTKIAEPSAPLNSPGEVAKRYAYLEKYDRERLIRIDLDNENRVIGEELVAIGTADAALMSPREIFRGAILNGATRIIVVHNHPSGNAEPSREDLDVREKLVEAGKLLAVPVVDFVIVGEGGRYWCSSGVE